MTYAISKRFEFSASHVLDGLADDHPCSRLHGHNYAVELELCAETLDPVGFVWDYRALDSFKAWLDRTLDHRHLNDVLGDTNPSAENLARYIHVMVGERRFIDRPGVMLTAVTVHETPRTWAEFRP